MVGVEDGGLGEVTAHSIVLVLRAYRSVTLQRIPCLRYSYRKPEIVWHGCG